MTHDMKKTLMRMLTLMLLMMVSLGARADVKVLFGENGTEKYEGKGGTIQVKQEESRDGGKVTVRLAFIPDKNYTFDEQSLEVYKVFSPESATTRALEIDGDALKLEEDKSTNPSEKHYHVEIDSKLALWVKVAQFISESKADPTRSDDYSGTYFIGSVGYKSANTTNNYYLCPTEGWCYYQATDNFTGTDNGMPFLTTYQCRDGVYDVRKAIWTIEKAPAPNEAYYYIKQASTGRYLTSNGKINTTNNADRLRVHLEAVAQENLDDKELFTIESDNGHYVISPKDVVGGAADRKWLVVNGGNQNALTGQQGKQNGPTGYTNTAGIIGVYTKTDTNAPFYLEEAIIPPAFTINADGSVELSSLEGTSIRYTTDGTTPTAGSTEYTAAIQVSSTMTSIKAIAIRTSDNKASDAVTLPLHTYTYYIVNKSGDIAIKQVVKQAEGKALGSMADIPADIRSPYLIGETVKFYSFDEAFTSAEQLTDEVKISTTPQADANIYVTYTTDHLSEKFLRLRGARAFNIVVTNEGYAFDNNGTLAYDNTEANKTQTNHLWNISGGDPYAVQIENLGTHKYLVSSTMPTLSLAATATNNFILMEESAATDAVYESVMLIATGTGDLVVTKAEFQASPVNITTKYYLIDKAGKLIQGDIESESSELGLPDEWRSPLVSKYHYYSTAGRSGETYSPTGEEITSPFEVGADGNIYVTYDVSDAIDLDGRNSLRIDGKENKTYMLRYLNGEKFYQENGEDDVMDGSDTRPAELRQAVYPYSNGDAALYVYGPERWNQQLASGASTRSRWLWLIEPANNPATKADLDPYHVFISSNQTQTNYKPGDVVLHNYHSYFRTYQPDGYDKIVTGVTNDNPKTTGGAETDPANNSLATEYMILGTLSQSRLVTLHPVPLDSDHDGTPESNERRTINSFEMYWKNNPTIQGNRDHTPMPIPGVLSEENQVTTEGREVTLTSQQKAEIESHKGYGWHVYQEWANSAAWVNNGDGTTGKKYLKEEHVFQTINMGATGEFVFEAVTLVPQVILLDQHGWEIMRVPLSNTTKLKEYNSPMVDEYQWYSTSYKIPGYHKYTVSGTPAHVSTSITDVPSGDTDFYVTYTVKSEYANAYTGAATSDATIPSAYLLKQGGSYASTNGSAITATTAPASMEDIPNVMQWNLRPNFDIDREMGYKYAGEAGAQDGAKNKEATDQDNYDEGRNGFDPYNVQIQSVAYPLRYFTANTEGIALDGGTWKGTSSTINFQNLSNKQTADGYDQTKLNITNATFMVVDDGAGNMRLMPRFDNSKVVTFSSTPFKTLVEQTTAATAGDEGTGTQTLWLALVPKAMEVHFSSEMTDMNGHYLLAEDFTFDSESRGSEEHPFRGIIDGQLNTISGTTSVPLVAYADGGAIIRNVILEEVDISTGTNVGAICCEATGSTRIYNCGILGGSVGGSGDVGGIVGSLDGSARVINCYSYATITGGNNVGGIVGNNKGTTTASNINTMVMNCMFYGDITGGTTVSPVFGGNNIDNRKDGSVSGLNTFNFYAYDKLKTQTIDSYNSTLAVEERFLTRFEFYRLLLNSNKKLAAYYATGSVGNSSQMFKWVLETADRTITDPKPYPILKVQGTYPSIINPDVENAPDSASVGRNKGGKLGKTLSVTIYTKSQKTTGGQSWPTATTCDVQTTSLTLVRTDMDAERFNFNYDKVQLPYYNDVGTGNYTEGRVVTGWKIVSMEGGTVGTYTTSDSWGGYNFADRYCKNKDLYSVSGRVFAQGAYFDVPYGVTAITIEPYWGYASFVADERYDVVYDNGYGNKTGVTAMGKQVDSWTFNGVSVKTDINSAFGTITTKGTTVYDNAVVLVGNFHQATINTSPFKDTTPFTLMSVDLDHDNEPDYSLIYHDNDRRAVCPIRFDFLNIIGTAQAQKPYSSSTVLNASVFNAKAWFEITNTCLIYFSQFEYENSGKTTGKSPIILLGGVYDQFTSTKVNQVQNTTYLHVGGNAWFNDFGNGTHSDGNKSTKHIPISVTGGDYRGFYLTGTYNQSAAMLIDDAECYISGGHFGEAAGAGQEQIGGNVHWQIYNADIDNFYGGGVNHAKPILGTVTVDIMYSHVGTYCGGPKFGNMSADKAVKTSATGCTFGTYFGAGYGGTSYSRVKYRDEANENNKMDFNSWQNLYATSNGDRGKYYDGTTTKAYSTHPDYGQKGLGVAVDFDYEFFVWTSGKTGGRFFVKFASFSLAQCDNVESKLKKCIIENNYYGGGSLGKVAGTVTSELEDCTVKGNVFGAGYSASLPTLQVRDAGFETIPSFNKYSGMFQPGVPAKPTANDLTGTTEFKWKQVNAFAGNSKKDIEEENVSSKYVHTDANLSTSNLGSVAGSVNLTIKGKSVIGTLEGEEGSQTLKEGSGNVFGGGQSSYVVANPNIKDQKVTVNLEGETEVLGNVYGGGDEGEVQCSTEVNIR